MITQAELKEYFRYEPRTGLMYRIKKHGHRSALGIVGTHSHGYLLIRHKKILYRIHRLAFLYMNNNIPDIIDHINGVRDCNIFVNLRPANKNENAYNMKISINNSSNYKGVSFQKDKAKWSAKARANNINYHLGYYSTAELASIAYQEFCKKNHGEFYRAT